MKYFFSKPLFLNIFQLIDNVESAQLGGIRTTHSNLRSCIEPKARHGQNSKTKLNPQTLNKLDFAANIPEFFWDDAIFHLSGVNKSFAQVGITILFSWAFTLLLKGFVSAPPKTEHACETQASAVCRVRREPTTLFTDLQFICSGTRRDHFVWVSDLTSLFLKSMGASWTALKCSWMLSTPGAFKKTFAASSTAFYRQIHSHSPEVQAGSQLS